MATSPPPLARAHRSDLVTLTGLAERDLAELWRELANAEVARDQLTEILIRLVALYGAAAGTLAADYFDEARDAAGVRGRYRAAPAEPVNDAALAILAGVATKPLFRETPDTAAALTLAQGGLQRHVANVDRETIRLASVDDRQTQGWVRVGRGECDWCQQYLDGVVHYVEGYDFNAHDHCQCTAEPVFDAG